MITNLINKAKEHNISLEVCTYNEKEYYIETLNEELITSTITKTKEYNVKALYNGKVVTISTEKIDNPDEIIKLIIDNANLTDNSNENRLCENDFEVNDRKETIINPNDIKNELFKLNKYFHEKYAFLVNVDAIVNHTDITRMIDNENHHMKDSYGFYNVYFIISGKKKDTVKSINSYTYGCEIDFDKFKEEVENDIKKLKLSFDATSIKTDKYKVLINNLSLNRIMSTVANFFNAKPLDMKTSPLAGKLNEKVFSDKISLLIDPVNENFMVNKHFDNEGTLTRNIEIVKDGVFKTALNNLEYAIKNNTEPTGNANMICNYHLKPGEKSFDELIKEMDNGIIINTVEGLHAGINNNTGAISLQSTGFLVENGEIIKPLDMIILQTNIFELLSNVIEVGKDLREFDSSYSSPSILLDNITISGNL